MDISLEKKVTSPLVIMSGSLDSAAHENVPVTAVVRSGFTKPRVEVSEMTIYIERFYPQIHLSTALVTLPGPWWFIPPTFIMGNRTELTSRNIVNLYAEVNLCSTRGTLCSFFCDCKVINITSHCNETIHDFCKAESSRRFCGIKVATVGFSLRIWLLRPTEKVQLAVASFQINWKTLLLYH